MTYDTMNPVPSVDPRDLDDNAQAFDRFLQSTAASEPDRFGVPRKTWHQMELDAAALVSPNVAALAAVSPGVDKAVFFNASSPVGMGTYTLNSFNRSLGSTADGPAFRAAIGAIGSSDSITGSAATLTTARTISATGDATWSVSFNGSGNATGALVLVASGVGAGTYGAVTVNAKGLVTAATVATPVANGGTGSTTAAAALAALGGAPLASPTLTGVPVAPTAAAGTNTMQLANTAYVQAELTQKQAWVSYTPTVTAVSGSYTTISATGSYTVIRGICFLRIKITVTAIGTGVKPKVSLPLPALSGTDTMVLLARETAINGKSGVATILSDLVTLQTSDYANADLSTQSGCVVSISGSYPIA